MKYITLAFLLFTFLFSNAQSLPFDFESAINTSDFEDFDGGTATVIDNPQSVGDNTSNKVAQIVRNGGQIWAGSKVVLEGNLVFSTNSVISMKVFTTAPEGITVKFKLEGLGGVSTERDQSTTVSGEWETLKWDFTGASSEYNTVVFMFDFGSTGDGTATSTFLFDDVKQEYAGEQIDLPVTFEGSSVNLTTTDFGGNSSSLVPDPEDANNTVVKVIKTTGAATWAGTTIGTNAGFATDIPLTLSNSVMSAWVWSPDAGIPVRLKVEDSNDPTHTCETQTNTTTSNAWEIIEFDFSNEANGTATLSNGLDWGWTYNMASIFFNFDTDGATAGEKTYYFDHVVFGKLASIKEKSNVVQSIYPNPSNTSWTINAGEETITKIDLYDTQGNSIETTYPETKIAEIGQSELAGGVYVIKTTTASGFSTNRVIKL